MTDRAAAELDFAAARARGAPLAAAVTASLLLALVLIEFANPAKDGAFNADSTYLLALTGDLLHGGRLSDWSLAPHYYFVPDGVLSAFILGARDLGLSLFAGSVALFGASLIAVAALLWRRVSGQTYAQSLPWAALTIVSAFAAAALAGRSHDAIEPVAIAQLLFPALHGGTFTAALLSIEIVLALMAPVRWSVRHRLLLAGLAAIAALVTLSDLIFVPWGLAPLAIVLASRWRQGPRRRVLLVLLTATAAAAFGYLLSLSLGNAVRGAYVDGLRVGPVASVSAAVQYLWRAAMLASPVAAIVFYANFALWLAAAAAFRRAVLRREADGRNQVLIALGALSALSIVAPALFGIVRPAMVRIFLPYMALGLAVPIGFALVRVRRWLGQRSDAVPAVLAGMMLLAGAVLYRDAPPLAADRLAACLSERGLVSGAASYWQAMPVMVATRQRVHVVPLQPDDLKPFRWMIKRQWLSSSRDGPNAAIEFVVTGRDALADDTVRAVLGPPQATVPCADWTLLLYAPARPVPGRR